MKKYSIIITLVLVFALVLTGCNGNNNASDDNTKKKVVATTTMLADLSKIIGGEHVEVDGLMGPGIDPHLYQASAGDVTLMQEANIVVYNGLHLEGKMGEIFKNLKKQETYVICIEDGIDQSALLSWEEDENLHDPHIWFDTNIWKQAAKTVAEHFGKADPDHKDAFDANLESYLKELDKLDEYIKNRVAELPENQRVLITAHDAFNYFGKAYGFEVKGLQGISTDSEAATSDMSSLADFIVENQIKAIFVESSVPPKTIEALQAAVKAKGFDVGIGGELYSDSLGSEGDAKTYIGTCKANIDTIVDALKK